jgi:uncharacterized membrane protein
MRSGVARLTCLLAGAFLAATMLPAEALARAGSGSSSFGRSLGHGGGYRTRGSGGHVFFFGGGGGGGGGLLLLLVILVVVMLIVASRRGGRRRRS